MHSLPVVLTIAGSDNSCGAGVQADLKTMSALGVYGVTAVTCIVAEVPGKVSLIQPVQPEIVREQVRLLFEAFPISALKTGMLHSLEILNALVEVLEGERSQLGKLPPLVVDPVMVATSGVPLMKQDALEGYRNRLFEIAELVTPNLDEVAVLLGRSISSREQMIEAGRELVAQFGTSFLIKGGHLRDETASDVLISREGVPRWFDAPFVRGVSTHGTGCTYSAAIAAGLGKGLGLEEAILQAKIFLTNAVAGYLRWAGKVGTTDALHHFFKQGS